MNNGGCSRAGAPRTFGASQSPVLTIPFASTEYMASSYPARSPRRMAPRKRMADARARRRKRSRGVRIYILGEEPPERAAAAKIGRPTSSLNGRYRKTGEDTHRNMEAEMDDDRRFQHFLRRDPAYDGKFLTGVLTTG